MAKERTGLKRMLAGCERGRGKRYPAAVKREVVRYARRRREEGASWATIGDEIGLWFETLRRWCQQASEEAGVIARVEVAEEPRSEGVSIVSPSGFRLEGLDAAAAVAALKALG